MKPETRFRQSLRVVNNCYVMAIEPGNSQPGFPDTIIQKLDTNRFAFVELKCPDKKSQKRGCIGMRKEQVVWHSKAHRRGSSCNFILVKFDSFFTLWEGKYAADLKDKNCNDVSNIFSFNTLMELRAKLTYFIFPGDEDFPL